MNIYFGGTMRGAHSPKSLYAQIGDHLKTYGTVLAEHVAHAFQNQELYNVHFSEQDIFAADVEFMDNADVVVAEVSLSSYSIGWELCYAQHVRKVPILALYKTGADVSIALRGNKYIMLREYSDEASMQEVVDAFMAGIGADA